MINTNQSKLTPTFDRNTDRGGTTTWEQCKYPKNDTNNLKFENCDKLRLNEKPLNCVQVV